MLFSRALHTPANYRKSPRFYLAVDLDSNHADWAVRDLVDYRFFRKFLNCCE